MLPAVSLGYKLADTVRLGVGAGLSIATYSDEETFAGLAPISGRTVGYKF